MFVGRECELNFLEERYAQAGSLWCCMAGGAWGNTKLNDISMKSLIDDTSKTSVYLKNLIELGIVQREFSVSEGVKEKANTNRGLYKLTDNFFRFWYSFVFTNYSELEAGNVDGVYKYSIEPSLHEFAAAAFEDICREYVRELQKADALPFRYSEFLDVKSKLLTQQENAKIYYYLFAESGFDDKIVEAAKADSNVVLCDLADIVVLQ